MVIELPPLEESEKMIVEVSPKFDQNAVPWNYGTNEIDGVSQSDRCYAPREK